MPTLDANNNIIVTPADIRRIAPEFADLTDEQIAVPIEIAGCYISTALSGDIGFKRRAMLIELLAAHLLKIGQQTGADGAGNGGTAGLKSAASVGQVSVSYAIPEDRGSLHYFLNQTTYGQQYAALLAALATPIYFGGTRQRVL